MSFSFQIMILKRIVTNDHPYYQGLTMRWEYRFRLILAYRNLTAILFGNNRIPKTAWAIQKRQIRLNSGRTFSSFADPKLTRCLNLNLKDRMIDETASLSKLDSKSRVLVLASSGPGDEIRWGAAYQVLLSQTQANVTFTCDPRLESIFKRSFPAVDFIPVNRMHRLWDASNAVRLKGATQAPALSLYRVFDDTLWLKKNSFDKFLLVSGILDEVFEFGIAQKKQTTYLRADPKLKSKWQTRLSKHIDLSDFKLVGLSWRSTFLNNTRSAHYLEVDQILPWKEVQNCKFVVLQAKLSSVEKKWLEQNFQDKVLFVEELDSFNDFENLSALLSALDVVVSPTTYLIELAGALGVKSIMLSLSRENFYRRDPNSKKDYWFSSIKHAEADEITDKTDLVRVVANQLQQIGSAT